MSLSRIQVHKDGKVVKPFSIIDSYNEWCERGLDEQFGLIEQQRIEQATQKISVLFMFITTILLSLHCCI